MEAFAGALSLPRMDLLSPGFFTCLLQLSPGYSGRDALRDSFFI